MKRNSTPHSEPLVAAATRLAEQHNFRQSCLPAVGRLLHVLAGQFPVGRLAEIGTGYGVGTAWMASALGPSATLLSVEANPDRAQAVQALFAGLPHVHILHADWTAILAEDPFDLIFVDAKPAKALTPERVLSMLKPGGLVVIDDLTPLDQWPPEWQGQPDPVRDFWLDHPQLRSTEILVTPRNALILASRC